MPLRIWTRVANRFAGINCIQPCSTFAHAKRHRVRSVRCAIWPEQRVPRPAMSRRHSGRGGGPSPAQRHVRVRAMLTPLEHCGHDSVHKTNNQPWARQTTKMGWMVRSPTMAAAAAGCCCVRLEEEKIFVYSQPAAENQYTAVSTRATGMHIYIAISHQVMEGSVHGAQNAFIFLSYS